MVSKTLSDKIRNKYIRKKVEVAPIDDKMRESIEMIGFYGYYSGKVIRVLICGVGRTRGKFK